MIDPRALVRAFIVGTVLQIVLVILCRLSPWVMQHAFMFGGMMIAATAAYLYAMDVGRGWFPGATAGAAIGGACGFVGIVVAVTLHETAQVVIPYAVAICVLTGAVGGLFGQMAASWRAYEEEQRRGK